MYLQKDTNPYKYVFFYFFKVIQMENTKKINYEIKLPSSTLAVNKGSISKFMETISKTGSVFTKEQLIANGLYTKSDDIVSRNLAYLKYLGILDEVREKVKQGDKEENVQKFTVKSTQLVKDLLYELRAGRNEEARKHWHNMVLNHEITKSIREDFFKGDSTKTLIDLEHFLRAKTPGKSPGYYQQGGRFVVDLLAEAGILEESGNQLTLRMEGSPSETKAPLVVGILNREAEAPLANNTRGTDNSLSINSSSYLVTIKGPGMNHHIEISEEIDFNILNAILGKVRTKISDTKDGKQ